MKSFINSMDIYVPLTPSTKGTDIIEPVLVVGCDSAAASFYWYDTLSHLLAQWNRPYPSLSHSQHRHGGCAGGGDDGHQLGHQRKGLPDT
jgi:hypothetical protein